MQVSPPLLASQISLEWPSVFPAQDDKLVARSVPIGSQAPILITVHNPLPEPLTLTLSDPERPASAARASAQAARDALATGDALGQATLARLRAAAAGESPFVVPTDARRVITLLPNEVGTLGPVLYR